MTVSIKTFSIKPKLNATLSRTALKTDGFYAECCLCIVALMLNVGMWSVVMPSVVAPYMWSPWQGSKVLNWSASFITQAYALGLSFIMLDRCINGLNFNMFLIMLID